MKAVIGVVAFWCHTCQIVIEGMGEGRDALRKARARARRCAAKDHEFIYVDVTELF